MCLVNHHFKVNHVQFDETQHYCNGVVALTCASSLLEALPILTHQVNPRKKENLAIKVDISLPEDILVVARSFERMDIKWALKI